MISKKDDAIILIMFILIWILIIYGMLAIDCNCWKLEIFN